MKKFLTLFLFVIVFFSAQSKAWAADYSCGWTNDGTNLLFCVTAPSLINLKAYGARITCVENCDYDFIEYLFSASTINFNSFSECSGSNLLNCYTENNSSSYTACTGMSSVGDNLTEAYNKCLETDSSKTMSDCAPVFRGDTTIPSVSGTSICSKKTYLVGDDAGDITNYAGSKDFVLCNQISNSEKKAECEECIGDKDSPEGIWTAVGCIPTKGESLITTIIKIGLGVAGGIALLIILVAAFMLSTSQGEPQKKTEAKEMITSAIIGLLFIIFSVTILQFIGVKIFQIPGFGET